MNFHTPTTGVQTLVSVGECSHVSGEQLMKLIDLEDQANLVISFKSMYIDMGN